MKKPKIFSNNYFKKCIELATNSKGNERYGSIIVQNNEIIGEGYNRSIAHLSFGRLEREIRQGYANHAEIEALNDALTKKINVDNSELYVAGYFSKSNQLFFQKEYTCTKCIPHLQNYGVASINLPTPNGWIKKPLDKAQKEAKKFVGGTHEKRLNAAIGNFYLDDLFQ